MVRKKDFGIVFFIYLSLFHVYQAHPCGINPLKHVEMIARRIGKDTKSLLETLRLNNVALYSVLNQKYKEYAYCLGRWDTSYYKRSQAPNSLAPYASPLAPFLRQSFVPSYLDDDSSTRQIASGDNTVVSSGSKDYERIRLL